MQVVFLVVAVHKAEELPQMDKSVFGGAAKGAGIDAYVKIDFAGYKASTRVIKSRRPRWGQEFLIPVLTPTIGQMITIKVRDHDLVDPDDDVDILTIPFEAVEKKQVPKHGWWNLYGLDGKAEDSLSNPTAIMSGLVTAATTGGSSKRTELNKHRKFYSSTWRGKLLLSLSVYRPDKKSKKQLPEKLLKRPVESPRPDDPLTVPYVLHAAAVLVADTGSPPGVEGKVDSVVIQASAARRPHLDRRVEYHQHCH